MKPTRLWHAEITLATSLRVGSYGRQLLCADLIQRCVALVTRPGLYHLCVESWQALVCRFGLRDCVVRAQSVIR